MFSDKSRSCLIDIFNNKKSLVRIGAVRYEYIFSFSEIVNLNGIKNKYLKHSPGEIWALRVFKSKYGSQSGLNIFLPFFSLQAASCFCGIRPKMPKPVENFFIDWRRLWWWVGASQGKSLLSYRQVAGNFILFPSFFLFLFICWSHFRNECRRICYGGTSRDGDLAH